MNFASLGWFCNHMICNINNDPRPMKGFACATDKPALCAGMRAEAAHAENSAGRHRATTTTNIN